MPGISTFVRDIDGIVFRSYSTYGRGVEMVNGACHMLDLTPLGRQERDVAYKVDWLRRHDSSD